MKMGWERSQRLFVALAIGVVAITAAAGCGVGGAGAIDAATGGGGSNGTTVASSPSVEDAFVKNLDGVERARLEFTIDDKTAPGAIESDLDVWIYLLVDDGAKHYTKWPLCNYDKLLKDVDTVAEVDGLVTNPVSVDGYLYQSDASGNATNDLLVSSKLIRATKDAPVDSTTKFKNPIHFTWYWDWKQMLEDAKTPAKLLDNLGSPLSGDATTGVAILAQLQDQIETKQFTTGSVSIVIQAIQHDKLFGLGVANFKQDFNRAKLEAKTIADPAPESLKPQVSAPLILGLDTKQGNTIYGLGNALPDISRDVVVPTPLEGNPATVTVTALDGTQVGTASTPGVQYQGRIKLEFTAIDRTNDAFSLLDEIRIEHQRNEGGTLPPTWSPWTLSNLLVSAPNPIVDAKLDETVVSDSLLKKKTLSFVWDGAAAYPGWQGEVRFRITPRDHGLSGADATGADSPAPFLAPLRAVTPSYVIDNNTAPQATIAAFGADRRRVVPLEIGLVDAESDDAAVASLQWKHAGAPDSDYQPLALAAELFRGAASGVAGTTNQVDLSGIDSAAARVGGFGDLVGSTFAVRRPVGVFVDATAQWTLAQALGFDAPVALAAPVAVIEAPAAFAASPDGDEPTDAIVLDQVSATQWKLERISLVSGAALQPPIVPAHDGIAHALAWDGEALLVVGEDGGAGQLWRIAVDGGASTLLSPPTSLPPIAAIAVAPRQRIAYVAVATGPSMHDVRSITYASGNASGSASLPLCQRATKNEPGASLALAIDVSGRRLYIGWRDGLDVLDTESRAVAPFVAAAGSPSLAQIDALALDVTGALVAAVADTQPSTRFYRVAIAGPASGLVAKPIVGAGFAARRLSTGADELILALDAAAKQLYVAGGTEQVLRVQAVDAATPLRVEAVSLLNPTLPLFPPLIGVTRAWTLAHAPGLLYKANVPDADQTKLAALNNATSRYRALWDASVALPRGGAVQVRTSATASAAIDGDSGAASTASGPSVAAVFDVPFGLGPTTQSFGGVVHANFDADEASEIVACDPSSPVVRVYEAAAQDGGLAITNGMFALDLSDVIADAEPTAVAVGQLNSDADGYRDAVVADTKHGRVIVAANPLEAIDTIQALPGQSSSVTFDHPVHVALADFGADGRLEIAVANKGVDPDEDVGAPVGGSLFVVAKPFGAAPDFVELASLGALDHPRHLAVADVDGDGFVDVVSANGSGDSITYHRGLPNLGGVPQFMPALSMAVSGTPKDVALADLDTDGFPDLASATPGANQVAVMRFVPAQAAFDAAFALISTGSVIAAEHVSASDLDRDGTAELLVAGTGRGAVIRSALTAPHVEALEFGTAITSCVGADLDGDGDGDALAYGPNGLRALLHSSVGEFALPADVRVSVADVKPLGELRSADLDADGDDDLIETAQVKLDASTSRTVTVVTRQTSPGAFDAQPQASAWLGSEPAATPYVTKAAVAFDAKGDGAIDVVAIHAQGDGARVAVYSQHTTDGLFGEPGSNAAVREPSVVSEPLSGDPTALAFADIDADGRSDIVVATATGIEIVAAALAGTETKLPHAALTSVELANSPRIEVGDVDGDGTPEFVFQAATSDAAYVVSLSKPAAFVIDQTIGGRLVGLADLDGDGKQDVIVRSTNAIAFAPSGGATLVALFAVAPGAIVGRVGDWNGDGRVDLALLEKNQRVLLHRQILPAAFEASPSRIVMPGGKPVDLLLADIDGDRELDVATVDDVTADIAIYYGGH